ncbi:DUF2147 domain-containing protein [Pseudorhodoplanes sp.]|uniref:DUF2147 domain-containing protein n=1 Tax=Pseudorhodoplanes sp. TaxID=1934341 RepID=UPI003919FDBF
MKRLSIAAFLALTMNTAALAGDPTGEWLVEDGSATIRIAICSGSLWGVVGWEKVPGGQDTQNPDPAKRSRPTLGMPILIDMKPSGTDKWAGRIYNAKDGKMYDASVDLQTDNALRVRGCVLGGLFCGGETWARTTEPEPAPPAPGKSKAKGKPADPASAAIAGVCSRISALSGAAH